MSYRLGTNIVSCRQIWNLDPISKAVVYIPVAGKWVLSSLKMTEYVLEDGNGINLVNRTLLPVICIEIPVSRDVRVVSG